MSPGNRAKQTPSSSAGSSGGSKKSGSKTGSSGGSGSSGRSGGSGEDGDKPQVLRAVLLADCFQSRFKPFTVERPRCLLPLANTPMIEYALEFLAMNEVDEVYVYAGRHADQVEAYVSGSRFWPDPSNAAAPPSPFAALQFITLLGAQSVGDVLRDLDKRALVDGDFIVMHADVVANISLGEILEKHRLRRQKDKDAIMTMVLREAGEQPHRTRPEGGITPVFMVDRETGRCLHYDERSPLVKGAKFRLERDVVLSQSTDFEVRADLIDPGIDICTPEVLALWSEKFDYELPRKHFLNGVLRDWELNRKIYTHIVTDEHAAGYAARAHDLPMYEAITRDVVGRWTYPLVPDCNLVTGQTYRADPEEDVMVEDDVVIETGAMVASSVVGGGTTVRSGSRVTGSTIGRGCEIGPGVVIENSLIWDRVTIGAGTRVEWSIVADGATVGDNCTIPPGSLVSFGVSIGSGVALPEAATIGTVTTSGEMAPSDHNLLGPSGKGALFSDPAADNAESDDHSRLERGLLYKCAGGNLSSSSISTVGPDDDETEVDDADAGPAADLSTSTDNPSRARLLSFISEDGSTSGSGPMNFDAEGHHWLLDALRDENAEDDFESTRVEFLGLRLAHNASEAAVRRCIATALARRAAELLSKPGVDPTTAAARTISARHRLDVFIREIGIGGLAAGNAGQVSFVLALQAAMTRTEGVLDLIDEARAGTLLAALLQKMYSKDVLDEEGILAWWADQRSRAGGERMVALRGRCEVLVEWLRNAEEEEDSEEEDGD